MFARHDRRHTFAISSSFSFVMTGVIGVAGRGSYARSEETMTTQLEDITIGEIVAQDFRAAAVFQRFGIDFCCGGKRSVLSACKTADVEAGLVLESLKELGAAERSSDDLAHWPLDRLVAHIVDTHHAYIRSSAPTITAYLEKLVKVHGARHPELARVAHVFSQMSRELIPHMMKEEHVLFPYIGELFHVDAGPRLPSPFGTVLNPIRMMEREHEEVGNEMRIIRELTNDFTPPEDGCTTYRVCFAELKRFEEDLHRHVHLENNILFPKTVSLEQSRGQAHTGV
jgi:regulator of cell morphogenesis and NO signaling